MTGCRLAAVATVGFVMLTLLVAAGATRELDVTVRDVMRPGDVWGDPQLAADVVVEGIRPEVVVVGMLAVGAVVSMLRRTWAVLVRTVLLVAAAALPALVVKVTLGRPDPHDQMSSIGSFPSGHVMFVLVGLGGMLLVTLTHVRWWQWLAVGTLTVAMGVSLLLQAAHWSTDVIGGALLGVSVLGAAHRPWRRSGPASARRRVPAGQRRPG